MGLTIERFANDHGIDRMAVWGLEAGRRHPTFANVAKRLAAHGVGFAEFGRDMEAALEQRRGES